MKNIFKYLNIIKNVFLDEFSSVRLAIVLLVFLAISTLIGTILPEEPMVGTQELIKRYGIEKYEFLKMFGLTDVFHSWWYLALLTTFGINLTVASFKRVFPKWKLAFVMPKELSANRIKKMPVNCEIPIVKLSSLEQINNKLKDLNYKTQIKNNNLVASKGGWHRLGASVTHIGIMIILIGSAFSILTGFDGMAQIGVGEGFYLADLRNNSSQIKSSEKNNWIVPISKMPIWLGVVPKHLIKVNNTWREDYKSGKPKQWYSDISVLNNKKELYRKTIHVNNPLQYKGLDIYQSNWEKTIKIGINEEIAKLPLESRNGNEIVFLPLSKGVAFKFKLVLQENNLRVDKNLLNKSTLEIYSVFIGKDIKEKILGKINMNESIQIGPVAIKYLGSEIKTGLQFKSNPGDLLIYPGIIFMIFGVIIAIGAKKQLWASIDETSNMIVLGGKSDRAAKSFSEEFENIVLGLTG